ncbi:MAG: hypothetical protein WC154_05520, partial [Candidatus Izemoplasmatales bacterium]
AISIKEIVFIISSLTSYLKINPSNLYTRIGRNNAKVIYALTKFFFILLLLYPLLISARLAIPKCIITRNT